MKGIFVFVLLLCYTESYGQETINYRVRHKPIPILENTNGKVLARVPRNHAFTFVEYTDSCGCFLVEYKKTRGIIDSASLMADVYGDEPGLGHERIMTNLKNKLDPELKAAALKRKSELIRKYGYPEGLQVSERKIWIGMTVDMTLDSWGIPYKIKRSSTDWGPREQWVYSDAYLYFENGILAEIMTIKASER
ncbi:MAG TPA: hypothetical protein VK179_05915 [Bacteroidales bacterium]|nr:hypothetical protein [Bacteroidales bacterium]